MEPELQNQHRVPQVYLKQFGYKLGGKWNVCVLDRAKNQIEDIPVREFSVTINEFDYPSEKMSERRHFENTASFIEGMYYDVVKHIKQHNLLLPPP